MKEVHLSDGAMQAVRDDLVRGADGELTAGSKYIAKALDEVEWLRGREESLQLELRLGEAEARNQEARFREVFEERDAARAEVKRLTKEMTRSEHDCGHCGNPAENTERREMFGAMRTACSRCGKWWTTDSPHPNDESKEGE